MSIFSSHKIPEHHEERIMEIEILRYDPDKDEAPYYQSYKVPCQEQWVILDAINYIKDHIDRTLSYRWSCHMAVCGSCGMMVNGESTLTCHTFIKDMPDKLRIEPLDNFPITRDLVIEMDGFVDKLASVKPFIVPEEEIKEGETYTQSPEQLHNYEQYSQCINCLLCYSACPQTSLNDNFVGPAALALAHRYNLDSRDQGRSVREDVVASNEGIWECSFVGACSEVCPKDVDPAAAIQQTKIAATGDYFLQFLVPKKKDLKGQTDVNGGNE